MEIGGLLQEVLLDGGAAFSLITEEHLCEVLNTAVSKGLTPEDKNLSLIHI